MEQFIKNYHDAVWFTGIFLFALLLALAVRWILFTIFKTLARRTESHFFASLAKRERNAAGVILPLLVILVCLPELPFSPHVLGYIRYVSSLGLTVAFIWMLIGLTGVMADVILNRYKPERFDPLQARRVQTQVLILRRTFTVFLVMVGLGLILMTIPAIRHLGTGLFASAGIAGLAVGLAARPVLSNLIAGVQIALSQPIRMDDIVVVENEWGKIEEITTTFVIVRTWDLRRIVLPLTYFIEKPFQNWTRSTTELVGTVSLFVDYTAPVDEIRKEFQRLLAGHPDWDRQTGVLEVVNATEQTLELRVLMSSPDSDKSWALRCWMREKLIAYLQQHHPQCLPKTRAEIANRPI